MLELLDVSEQQFERKYRPLTPADAVKEAGGRLWIRARGLLDAWVTDERVKAVKAAAPAHKPASGFDGQGDALLEGPDSPELERYRRFRADMVELDLAERRKELIPVRELEPALMQGAAVIQRAGDALQRRFGNDASVILNDAVGEAVAGWERLFGAPKPAGDKEQDGTGTRDGG